MPLSQTSIQVLTYIEQCYYESGEIPSDEKLCEVVGTRMETLKNYWKDPDFRSALQARGVMAEGFDDSKALTMPQLLVANMLMNPDDRRSMRAKLQDPSLQAFGVTVQQVNGWMRSRSFKAHLEKRADALFGGVKPAAYKNFVSAIESGDQKAIALYFEMTGIYNPRVQVDVNVSVVLSRVVEIVSKHVKDPGILQLIAAELDGLEIGPAPMMELPVSDAIPVEAVEVKAPSYNI